MIFFTAGFVATVDVDAFDAPASLEVVEAAWFVPDETDLATGSFFETIVTTLLAWFDFNVLKIAFLFACVLIGRGRTFELCIVNPVFNRLLGIVSSAG